MKHLDVLTRAGAIESRNRGQTSYFWQLTAIADVAAGYGQASTRYCKVSVISAPVGNVTQLDTEDSNAGVGMAGALGA